MDAMKLVVAFHKVIPNGFGGPRGFEDDVHEIGIDGIFRKCISNSLVADDWIGCAGHMNEMRKIYFVSVDVIQYLQRGIHHAKQRKYQQRSNGGGKWHANANAITPQRKI
jgi:hypothetical protein